MTNFTFGDINTSDGTVAIKADGIEIERVKLNEVTDRLKELRAQAAQSQNASYTMASCYKRRNAR
jgi:hypothetical protein